MQTVRALGAFERKEKKASAVSGHNAKMGTNSAGYGTSEGRGGTGAFWVSCRNVSGWDGSTSTIRLGDARKGSW